MPTSGSITITATRNDIIIEALEQSGVIYVGGVPSSAQLNTCTRSMNYMLKSWQAKGINQFAIKKQFFFLTKDTNEYALGAGAKIYDDYHGRTTVTTEVAAIDTSIEVGSTANMTVGNTLIIHLNDGTNIEKVIDTITDATNVVVTVAVGGISLEGSVVYIVGTPANRPMKVVEAVRRDQNDLDIPIKILTLDEYARLSNKTNDGTPVQIYTQPNRESMLVNVWPEPANATDYIVLWVQRTLEDMINTSDELDYPQEWFHAISLGVAYFTAKKFGVPKEKRAELKNDFNEAFFDVYGYDQEEDGVNLQPDFRGEA